MALPLTEHPLRESRRTHTSLEENTSGSDGQKQTAADYARPTLTGNPRSILVVDDDASVCAWVAYSLEVGGYKTFKAESGAAAVEIFGREQIDGVLMEVQMPRMNGLETSKQLRALASDSGRELKVWFMTAVCHRGLDKDCAAAGGLSVFQKPFEWSHLLTELERELNPSPPNPNHPTAAGAISAQIR